MQRNKESTSNRTYRIYPLYEHMYNSCISITKRDNVTDYLLKKHFDIEEITFFPRKNRGKFLDYLIEEVYLNHRNINKVYVDHERITELREIMKNHDVEWNRNRVTTNYRVTDETITRITKMSEMTSKTGEVIELSVSYFVSLLNQKEYEMLRLYFDLQLKERIEE